MFDFIKYHYRARRKEPFRRAKTFVGVLRKHPLRRRRFRGDL